MKFNPPFLSAAVFALCFSIYKPSTLSAQRPLHLLNIKTAKDLSLFFRYTGKDLALISGHRGGNFQGYPENSIATFEHILKYTPAMFEIDPRLTKDSIIILMHDATLGRTTNGKGKVSDYTWDELKQLKLKDTEGNLTAFGIPALEEVMKWAKGKTILNLDKKDVPLAMIAALIKKHQAEAYIMLTVHDASQASYYHQQNKKLVFSAFIKSKVALDTYQQAGIPWSQMIAYIGSANKKENQEMFDLLHARGVMCMISAAPVYDKLPNQELRKAAYQAIRNSGADIIESDLPMEVKDAIKNLQPTQSPKKRYFGHGKL
ncbi:MAG: glycerophosphodiester phosphodiesterase family protein [Sphingobacteriaceae bacterium]